MNIYGRNTVFEALNSKFKVRKVFIENSLTQEDKIEKIIKICKESDISYDFVSNKFLSKLTNTHEHQGVAADASFSTLNLVDVDLEINGAFIYISESTFEQNIGAIIRTAECAGFNGVIIPNTIKISPQIAKISTGAIFHIPVISYPIYQTIKKFKKEGFNIYGIERGGETYFNTNLASKSLFIIGGEDKSLSEGVRTECDSILEIPQFGKINSLNMSNASSIIMYEYIRQNKNV